MHQIPNEHRLFLMGDYHSQESRLAEILTEVPACSCIILLGDIEARTSSDLHRLNEILRMHNVQMYCLRGNHDNPALWPSLFSHLILLEEIDCLLWKGMKIITVSGAVSLDRTSIRDDLGHCWPETEQITKDALDRVKSLGKCDILLTHTGIIDEMEVENDFVNAYASADDRLIEDIKSERKLIAQLQIASGCTRHYFGHFHQKWSGEQFGIASRCLDICEIIQLEYEFPEDIFEIFKEVLCSLEPGHRGKFAQNAGSVFFQRPTLEEARELFLKLADETKPKYPATDQDEPFDLSCIFDPTFLEKVKKEQLFEVSLEELLGGIGDDSKPED